MKNIRSRVISNKIVKELHLTDEIIIKDVLCELINEMPIYEIRKFVKINKRELPASLLHGTELPDEKYKPIEFTLEIVTPDIEVDMLQTQKYTLELPKDIVDKLTQIMDRTHITNTNVVMIRIIDAIYKLGNSQNLPML